MGSGRSSIKIYYIIGFVKGIMISSMMGGDKRFGKAG